MIFILRLNCLFCKQKHLTNNEFKVMWKIIKNTDLFLRFTERYEIFVTDFVTVWFSYLSKTTFMHSLKESNILLEMAEDTLIQKGIHVLSNPGDLKSVNKKVDSKGLILSLTMLFGYPFKVTLKLCEGSRELFFQMVTQPLLKTISELKSSQAELCELLNKKDSEIEEYKCMGGEIAIKFLKTKQFDEVALMNKYQMYQEYFGSSDDTVNSLLNIKVNVPEDITNVKKELEEPIQPVQPTIKMEPDSQPTETHNVPLLTSLVNMKQEPESPIKRESPFQRESQSSIPDSRKRMKKLNL